MYFFVRIAWFLLAGLWLGLAWLILSRLVMLLSRDLGRSMQSWTFWVMALPERAPSPDLADFDNECFDDEYCPECHEWLAEPEYYDYCPHCGAALMYQ